MTEYRALERCDECGSRVFSQCDELQNDGTFEPGSQFRCVNCKLVVTGVLAHDPWIICSVCEGEGTVVNPSIDAGGITGLEMEEILNDDPDFLEDYMGGTYDVSCAACHGTGKMRQSHLEELRQNAEDRKLAAMEDGDYEAYQGAGDYRWG